MRYAPENTEPINETMCLQGSAWCIHKDDYFNWNVCDETLGSWGGQGVELGVQAWRHGGVCYTNKLCHYAHLFRTEEHEFPYERKKEDIDNTQAELVKRFKTKDIAGLIRKFNYPANWTEEAVNQLS